MQAVSKERFVRFPHLCVLYYFDFNWLYKLQGFSLTKRGTNAGDIDKLINEVLFKALEKDTKDRIKFNRIPNTEPDSIDSIIASVPNVSNTEPNTIVANDTISEPGPPPRKYKNWLSSLWHRKKGFLFYLFHFFSKLMVYFK